MSSHTSVSISVEREQFFSQWQPPTPQAHSPPRPAPSSAIKHLSTVNSDPMLGRIQQSPGGGCQQEAHGKEASEQRAERQEEVPQCRYSS